MTRIGYPSDDFPNPVPFYLEIPEDWAGLHLPQTLMAARAPDPVDGYRANVIVTWQRIAADGDVEQLVAAIISAAAEQHQDFKVTSQRTGEADGLPVVALEASVIDGNGASRGQRHFLVAGPATSHRTRDLFHVIGTNDGDDVEGDQTIGAILQSFVLIDPAALMTSAATGTGAE